MFPTYYAKAPLNGLCLHSILFHETKREMIEVAKMLGFRVSTRLQSPDYALRLADVMLENPKIVLSHLDNVELEILEKIIVAGDGEYTPVAIRDTVYKLQELGLTVTYVDEANQLWWLLMPKELRECLATHIQEHTTTVQYA